MKTAAKVFLILDMILSGIYVIVAIALFAGAGAVNSVPNTQGAGEVAASGLVGLGVFFIIYAVVLAALSFGCIRALNRATSRSDLIGWGIVALLFCGIIPGILMLCISDEDLQASKTKSTSRKYDEEEGWRRDTSSDKSLEEKLAELKRLHDSGQVTDEEYEKARQQLLFK